MAEGRFLVHEGHFEEEVRFHSFTFYEAHGLHYKSFFMSVGTGTMCFSSSDSNYLAFELHSQCQSEAAPECLREAVEGLVETNSTIGIALSLLLSR
jgi:hypothetical protein